MGTLAKLLVELNLDNKDFVTGMDESLAKSRKLGPSLMKTGGMMTAAFTAPMILVGKTALDVAKNFDDALDTIQTKTGATGEDLEAFGDVAREVFRSIPTTMQEAAETVATLAQRTGAAGDELSKLAQTEIELARITGTDLATNVDVSTKMFDKWNISTANQASVLDKVFIASQQTGVGVDTLMQNVTKFAGPLQAFGFSFEESIAILGQFEAAGVNVNTAMAGLKTGLAKMAKEGVTDAHEAFTKMVDAIKAAPDDMAATQVAIDLFGAKAGPELAKAIREGKLDVESLMGIINGGGPGIIETANATNDYAEKLQILKNRASDALLPLGTQLFEAINSLMPLFETGASKLGSLIEKFNSLPAPVQQAIGMFVLLLGVSGPILMALGSIMTIAPMVGAAFTLMTGPIGLAVFAIIAAIALLMYAYQTNLLGFRDGVQRVWREVTEAFNAAKPVITDIANLLGTAFTAAEPVVKAALDLVKTHITSMAEAAKMILDGMVQVVKGTMQVIKGVFTGDWGLIKQGVTNIVTGLKTMLEGNLRMMLAHVTLILSSIKEIFTSVWDAVKETVTTAISTATSSAIETLTTFATDAYNTAYSAAYGIGEAIIAGLAAIWDSIMDNLDSLIGAIGDKLGGIDDLVPGFLKSIPDKVSAVSPLSALPMGVGAGLAGANFNFYVSGEQKDPKQIADESFEKFVREFGLLGGGAG